jgi:hypothetical protein
MIASCQKRSHFAAFNKKRASHHNSKNARLFHGALRARASPPGDATGMH